MLEKEDTKFSNVALGRQNIKLSRAIRFSILGAESISSYSHVKDQPS